MIERLIYRTLRKRDASLVAYLVSSLGLLIVIQSVISLLFSDATLGLHSFDRGSIPLQFIGISFSKFQFIFLGITILSGVCLAVFLAHSNEGIIMRAVANNWDLSTVVGIDVNRSILLSMVIGSAFSSLAGILWSHNTALHPNLGLPPLLSAIAATVIGGASNLLGTFAGCILVVTLQQLSLWFLPGEWQDVIVFTTLLIFLIFKPHGILGKPVRKAEI